ncbi:hypothetical protein AAFF27_07915 [Xylophilus sp. GW821-FHT01B05]
MGIGWMTALKLVPWGDVIEATPKIVKGAKKLFTSTREAARPAAGGVATVPPDSNDPAAIAQLAHALQAQVAALEKEQRDSAELIASLAEQNALIVKAVDALRKRVRLLSAVCIVLLASVTMLVVWAAQR